MCKNLWFVIYKSDIIQRVELLNIHHYNCSQEMDSIAAMREYVLKWTNELFAGWGDTPTSKQLTIILVHTWHTWISHCCYINKLNSQWYEKCSKNKRLALLLIGEDTQSKQLTIILILMHLNITLLFAFEDTITFSLFT